MAKSKWQKRAEECAAECTGLRERLVRVDEVFRERDETVKRHVAAEKRLRTDLNAAHEANGAALERARVAETQARARLDRIHELLREIRSFVLRIEQKRDADLSFEFELQKMRGMMYDDVLMGSRHVQNEEESSSSGEDDFFCPRCGLRASVCACDVENDGD